MIETHAWDELLVEDNEEDGSADEASPSSSTVRFEDRLKRKSAAGLSHYLARSRKNRNVSLTMESYADVFKGLNREQEISMIRGGGGGCAVTCATHGGEVITFPIAHSTSASYQPTPLPPPRDPYPMNISGTRGSTEAFVGGARARVSGMEGGLARNPTVTRAQKGCMNKGTGVYVWPPGVVGNLKAVAPRFT